MAVRHTISKANTSPLTTGTLWTFTGGIRIFSVIGIVTTVIQSQATTCKISAKCDALTAVDLCATGDLNALAVGTVLRLGAALATAMPITDTFGVALTTVLENTPRHAVCITSGIITVTYGAASTGAITWYMSWEAIVPGSTVI